jgi:hypothetical protein
VKESHSAHHNDRSLKETFPHPDQKSLSGKSPTFLECGIQDGVLHNDQLTTIFICNKTEHRKHRIDGSISKNQVSIIYSNRNEVKDNREDSLDDGDD